VVKTFVLVIGPLKKEFDMTALQQHQDICCQFSTLLSYPKSNVVAQAVAFSAQLKEINAEASAAMEGFTSFLAANDINRIEEAFTGTFDLQSLCHPYVGYQLCGESQQRTMFMIKLQEIYKQYGFVSGNELPDHLTEVLRFIGSISDQACRQEIIQDGLLPALEKITKGIESEGHPYVALLNALQSFLSETVTSEECIP
jgi:nitrate reductase delta subunit